MVGRPCRRAVCSQAWVIGASSRGSASSRSSTARSAGSSRTSTGSSWSNNDSTWSPANRSIHASHAGARFVDARIRFTTLIDMILEGADLSGADLTESSLNGVRFDPRTRFEGAKLASTRLDDDLARFVAGQAAPQGPEQHGFALAHLDATVNLLRARNRDGHLDAVLARMGEARQTVARDPDFDWSTVLTDFSDEVVDEVAEAAGEADVSEGS